MRACTIPPLDRGAWESAEPVARFAPHRFFITAAARSKRSAAVDTHGELAEFEYVARGDI